MDLLLVLAVVVLAMVLTGVLLGKLSWERGITLLLVAVLIFAVIYFLLGRVH